LIIFVEQENLSNDPHMPEKARQHCTVGYIKILGYVKRSSVKALYLPFLPSDECSGRSKCKAASLKSIKDLPVWRVEESESPGIFNSWDSQATKATEVLCSQCRAEAERQTDKIRAEFWAVLPTMFGLPPWKDLKDEF
jgi:hypothetical protein